MLTLQTAANVLIRAAPQIPEWLPWWWRLSGLKKVLVGLFGVSVWYCVVMCWFAESVGRVAFGCLWMWHHPYDFVYMALLSRDVLVALLGIFLLWKGMALGYYYVVENALVAGVFSFVSVFLLISGFYI